MAIIKSVRGFTPKFGTNCFLAENAVVRGDVHSITIGDNTNIQDGAIIHCTYQRAKTIIGSNVSIAHNAIVHGCTVEDNVLVGMGAIIMDGAVIGSNSVIAAGAIVLPGTQVESGSMYAGNPAKRMKDISDEMREVIQRTAKNYPMYAEWFK
ncbi:MAG TPA: gamma carbonic anhydrase family protein [Cyclobacteriaceae bacterium]